jgi:phosphatidylglycerol lysyltransferase
MYYKSMPLINPWETARKNGQKFARSASLLTFASGLLLLLQPIIRHFYGHVAQFNSWLLPENIRELAFLANTVFGLMLIYVAYELLQRKRSAWVAALSAAILGLLIQILLGLPLGRDIFPLVLLIVLIIGKNQFVVKNPARNLSKSLQLLAVSIVVALVYGTMGFWLLGRHDTNMQFSLVAALWQTIKQYTLLDSNDLVVTSRYAYVFLQSLSVVGAATILYCAASIFRPLKYEFQTLPAEREKARRLLEAYGTDSDGFFKLWPEDKSYFFSRDGQAFIAYRVARGAAIALGDPEGAPHAIPDVIMEFVAFCQNNSWIVTSIAASSHHQKLFVKFGFSEIVIGADAVIDTAQFVETTSRNKYFRNIKNRFQKAGFTSCRSQPPHNDRLLRQLKTISDEWLELPNHKEWGFISGQFSPQYLAKTPLLVVKDARGHPQAFATELPTFRANAATIDLMRHRTNAPKNIMDFLFLELIQELYERGETKFNLGLSPLARQKILNQTNGQASFDALRVAMSPFVSGQGLHRYKSKFEPNWQPRYVYYLGNPAVLPQIGFGILKLISFKTSRQKRAKRQHRR